MGQYIICHDTEGCNHTMLFIQQFWRYGIVSEFDVQLDHFNEWACQMQTEWFRLLSLGVFSVFSILTQSLLKLQIPPPALLMRSPCVTLQAWGDCDRSLKHCVYSTLGQSLYNTYINLSSLQPVVLPCLSWHNHAYTSCRGEYANPEHRPEWQPQSFGCPCTKSAPLALTAQPSFMLAELRVYF